WFTVGLPTASTGSVVAATAGVNRDCTSVLAGSAVRLPNESRKLDAVLDGVATFGLPAIIVAEVGIMEFCGAVTVAFTISGTTAVSVVVGVTAVVGAGSST